MSVTTAEALIAICVAKGEWADVRTLRQEDRVVSADFVRCVLTAMPLPQSDHQTIIEHQPDYAPFRPAGDFSPVPIAASGLRLRGATIDGLLDLTNCTGQAGAPLPALSLEECRLLGRPGVGKDDLQNDSALRSLDLSGASIVSLSLKDSAFTHVAMFHSRVTGAIDISGVKPLNGWTDRDPASGDMAAFRRAMKAAAVALRDRGEQTAFDDLRPAEAGEDGATRPSALHPHDYCWLDLTGSHIQGGILAQKVRLRAPRRDRTGLMHTPRWPRFALRLEAVEVAGTLDARGGSVFDGGVSLYIAEIRDEVWLGSGHLLKEEGVALDAQGARLGGVFAVAEPPLSVLGMVMLNSSRIAGHFNLQAADLDGDGGPSLMAEAATIGGDMTLGAGVAARGPVGMSGTSIRGELDMSGAILSGRIGRERGGVSREFCDAFHGRNLSVGSDAFLSDGFIAHGCVRLDGARVGGHFDLRGATLAGSIPNPYKDKFAVRLDPVFLPSATSLAALSCSDMSVGGCVRVGSSRPSARMFFAQGSVNLQRASIGKDLDIINATIARAPSGASDSPVMDLGWVAVSGTLILEANRFDGAIHLEHASTNILSDNEATGYGDGTNLMLNGFRYEAFHEPPVDHDPRDGAQLVDIRKDWLKRMPYYRPQPYANLARVFIRHGRPDEARDILVEKYRQERKARIGRLSPAMLRKRPGKAVGIALLSAASWLWGELFGYGLKPVRAVVTLTCAFLIGWAFFWFANNQREMMVIDQQPMAGYVINEQMVALRPANDEVVAPNVACGESISEALYALDVFIPLVDLRQESKCEISRAGDVVPFEGVVLFRDLAVPGEIEIYRYVKAIYALSGWLLISLAILTFSGVLQRRDAET